MIDTRKVGPTRNTHLFLEIMKAFILSYSNSNIGGAHIATMVSFLSGGAVVDKALLNLDATSIVDEATLQAEAIAEILVYSATNSYGLTAADIVDNHTTNADVAALIAAALPSAPSASALTLSLQTSTGAVGTQVSTTRNAYVMLNGLVSTTANIGGSSAGDIILEVAPTNSATAGDWIEWGRIGNSQTITLALALNSVQVTKGMAVAFVPAGYFVKARTAGSGTVSYTLTNAKQILI